MQRTQIYFDKSEKDRLLEIARKKGVTMAGVIREAVAEYLARGEKTLSDNLNESHGIWRDREDIADSDGYVVEMRRKWLPSTGDK